jgi:hypothetical protein
LVAASDVHLRQLRASANTRINVLAASVKMLLIFLDDLPDDAGDAERMHTAALWATENLTEFQRQASKYNRQSGERAAVVVASLRWLRERVQAVRDEPAKLTTGFQWDEWHEHKQRATSELEATWSELPAPDQIDFGKRRSDKKTNPK